MFFTPRHVKEARHCIEAARRILRYRIDLLTRDEYEQVDRKIEALVAATRTRDKAAIRAAIDDLETVAGRVVPARPHAGWRENCEVILVAIVIAAGVRAFIVEPFKIPTGSMQPTLNGIIASESDDPPPNPIVRAFDFVVRGRTYVNVIGKEDDVVVSMRERSYLNYFTFTDVIGQRSRYTIFAPQASLEAGFGIFAERNRYGQPPTRIRKGQPLARGWIDNGDFVLVNKMAYHFSPPKLADVFVFRTTGIRDIERMIPEGLGSQHYIKRLAGVPGNTLRIAPPDLYIDGTIASEPAFQRVMSEKNGYNGYTNQGGRYLDSPSSTVTVPPARYFALGDNSRNSLDSRSWGFVPEDNVTGKAFVVFWPFSNRWGFIE